MKKSVGFIGLGKMGANMVVRLLGQGYRVVAYDRLPDVAEEARQKGAICVSSLQQLVGSLEPRRIIWLMVPAGAPVDNVIRELTASGLCAGDVVVDGGNSHFRDSLRRAEAFRAQKVIYLDVGTSGGLEGAVSGLSLTVGGPASGYRAMKPLLKSLAAPGGFAHVGPSGSGHFAKMIHNAIEYGIMQAIGEGFELLAKGPFDSIDLRTVAHVWNRGGIIRSYLMELVEHALEKDPRLSHVSPSVPDTGEGRWALQEAVNADVSFESLAHAIFMRIRSRQEESFSAKVVAILRHEFGGHSLDTKK